MSKKENGLQTAILMENWFDFFKPWHSNYAFEHSTLSSIFHWKNPAQTDPPAYISPAFQPIQEAKIL